MNVSNWAFFCWKKLFFQTLFVIQKFKIAHPIWWSKMNENGLMWMKPGTRRFLRSLIIDMRSNPIIQEGGSNTVDRNAAYSLVWMKLGIWGFSEILNIQKFQITALNLIFKAFFSLLVARRRFYRIKTLYTVSTLHMQSYTANSTQHRPDKFKSYTHQIRHIKTLYSINSTHENRTNKKLKKPDIDKASTRHTISVHATNLTRQNSTHHQPDTSKPYMYQTRKVVTLHQPHSRKDESTNLI